MHKLHKVLKQIHKELEAAEDYIHCSSVSEDDVKDLYRSLSREELTHADKLINMCDKHIDSELKSIWEFEKEMLKDKLLTLKTKMSHLD